MRILSAIKKTFTTIYKARFYIICIILLSIPVCIMIFCYIRDGNLISNRISNLSAIMNYILSMFLGIVAISQAHKAHELSLTLYQQSERDYIPIFAISNIKKKTILGCNPGENVIIPFCHIDSTPSKCSGFIMSFTNYSRYPITNISITNFYPLGKKRYIEQITKDKDTLIPPNDTLDILICDCPNFQIDLWAYKFTVTCKNDFGYSTSIEVEIKESYIDNGEVAFHCKSVKQ